MSKRSEDGSRYPTVTTVRQEHSCTLGSTLETAREAESREQEKKGKRDCWVRNRTLA